MNIRLVIDQLVVDGLELPPRERIALRKAVHDSLAATLLDRAATRALPQERRARRETIHLAMARTAAGAPWGEAIGAAITSHVWASPTTRSSDQRGQ